MIENGRTEDLCRQMDDLADEYHTHHLIPQEYYNYKSNWWSRSNKIGSDTVPIRHRSDFKQTKPTMDTKLFFVLVELAKNTVDSLFLRKSPWRRAQH